MYSSLSAPARVELAAIELPGHGTRLGEPLIGDLSAMVGGAAQALVPLLDRPFAFFGHSMGALLAFELTHMLRRFSMPLPSHLFLAAHRAPQLERTQEPLHVFPEAEFRQRVKSLNGTPSEVFANQELLELFMPILRNDMQVCETYQYRQRLPLNCGITVYGGRDDRDVDAASLQAWCEQTFGPSELRLLDGDHFFINGQREQFLKIFSRDLETVLAGQGV